MVFQGGAKKLAILGEKKQDHSQKSKNWALGNCWSLWKGLGMPKANCAKAGLSRPYKAPYPLSADYRPEIDVTPELGEADASYYHNLLGFYNGLWN
jgi:hypothetical protein